MTPSSVLDVQSKVCPGCKEEKLLTEYSKDKTRRLGVGHYCKACYSAYSKKYRSIPANKKSRRHRDLSRIYGLTPDEYNALKEANKGHCQLCGTPESDTRMCVDHCHATGKVRGLICDKCNRALGYVGDNIQTLKNLITYLEQSR